MSAFVLKIVAMAAMVIDHVGFAFADILPGSVYLACRLAGRLAMPIFCFQIAEGLFYTKNAKKYILRLAVFAVASEIPFDLMVSGQVFSLARQNVGFTLLAGFCGILLFDSFAARNQKTLALLSVPVLGLAANFLHTDYGLYGVYFIFVFYYFRGKPRWAACALAVGIAMQILDSILSSGSGTNIALYAFALTALLPIGLYNQEKGKDSKQIRLLYYSIYPLHMLLLFVLRYVIVG